MIKQNSPCKFAKAVKSEYNKDYLFENCESVKETVRWTVFSFYRNSYAVRIPLWGKRKQPLQIAKAVKSEYNKDYLFENCESVKKTVR